MTARELNNIFERTGIGHVRLEKPYKDSPQVDAYVVDDNGNYIESFCSRFYHSIDINDGVCGFESDFDICDEDYDKYEIGSITFHTPAWAYPSAGINEIGGGLEVAESNCGITLTDYKRYENRQSEVDLYMEQAIKMFQDPLIYQNWLLKMFLDEQTLFLEKHWPMMKSLGFWMSSSHLYKRGFESEFTSEIWLEFRTNTGVSRIFIHQDLFTGRWVITDSVLKETKPEFLDRPYYEYYYNINDLSEEELKKIILKQFEQHGEDFWREEREFREAWNKEHGFNTNLNLEHSTYSINYFLEYKKRGS